MGQIKNIKLHIVTDIKETIPSTTMAAERTFIMIKPDGVARNLVAKIITRFEQRGYKLVAMKFMVPGTELLNQHYGDLKEKPFFNGLVKHIASSRCSNGVGGKRCGQAGPCHAGGNRSS